MTCNTFINIQIFEAYWGINAKKSLVSQTYVYVIYLTATINVVIIDEVFPLLLINQK